MPTILHLTDLHFGWGEKDGDGKTSKANRKVCLDGLLKVLKDLPSEWRPEVICISGDIAWRGSPADYRLAADWIDQLLSVCDLTYESVVVCPGNHDIIRSVATTVPRPTETTVADQIMRATMNSHYEKHIFSGFIKFCRKTGIPAMKLGDRDSYLVGSRVLKGIRFVSMNSSWFCMDDSDKEKLWIGLNHLSNT